MGDISDIKGGKRLPKGHNLIDTPGNHPYIKVKDMSNDKLLKLTEDFEYIENETFNQISQYVVKKSDLIISIVGTIGLTNIIDYSLDNANLTENCAKITNLKDGYNIEFIYYYLNSNVGQNLIQEATVGAVQKKLSIKNIRSLKIPFPNTDIQNKIVRILSTIDKKIEINKRINKNLQTLSKLLLKYHLEDFKPYLDNGVKSSEIGDIPLDWSIYDFDSISNIYNGYSYKSNELQPSNSAMVTIKNFNRDGSFRTDGFKEIIYSDKVKEHHFVNENDVLLSCTDVTQDADIIGNCILLLDKQNYDNIIMSMDLVKIESKKSEINNFLIAAILKSYRFKMHILGYVNGTTVLHLDKKGIKKFKLALPPDLSILKDLNDILKNIYKQIGFNQKEIKNLQNLRDTLLPKLMSGEIDVSKINCDLLKFLGICIDFYFDLKNIQNL